MPPRISSTAATVVGALAIAGIAIPARARASIVALGFGVPRECQMLPPRSPAPGHPIDLDVRGSSVLALGFPNQPTVRRVRRGKLGPQCLCLPPDPAAEWAAKGFHKL